MRPRLAFVLMLGVILSGCAGRAAQPDAPKTEALETRKVMALGDSITDGLEDQRPGAYRIALFRKLSEAGLPVEFVGSRHNGPDELPDKDHEGHPGWTIGQIEDSVDLWLDAYRPDIVLLHIGTNNLIRNETDGLYDQLRGLLDKICAGIPPDGKLYVATVVPIDLNNLTGDVAGYNKTLISIVNAEAKAGKPVQAVEMHDALGAADLRDGVHPTDDGYDKMAKVWFEALQRDMSR